MADAYQGSGEQVDATLGALLHSVLEATADGILVVDLEGRIRLTNSRFSELWRIPTELLQPGDHNLPLQAVLDQVPDPASFLARIRELYESPGAESLDVIRLRDGRVLERYSTPHALAGEVVGRVWSFRDITDREWATDALLTNEALYRTLVEQLPAVTYLDSADNESSLYLSPNAEQILGHPHGQLTTPVGWYGMIHPDDRAEYKAEVIRCVEEDRPFRGTYRGVRADGRVIWLREHEDIVRNAEGKAQFRHGLVLDVTAEIEVHSQLRRAEQLYRDLVEQLPGVTYLWRLDNTPVYVSPRVTEIFGCTPEEFAEGAWHSIIHPDDVERVRAVFSDALAAQAGDSLVEYRITHPVTGELRFLQATIEMVRTEDETLMQGLILDRTEQVLAEQALAASEADRRDVIASMLRAADDERIRISAELHDDTIQVLTGALFTADLALSETSRPAADSRARLARLRELLEQALERTRRLMFELDPQLLRASGLSVAIRELAGEVGREGGFDVQVVGELPRYASQFEALVYRTVREVITNARRHSDCRHLLVSMSGTGEQLTCTVTDDGVGFDVGRVQKRRDSHLHLGLRSATERVLLAGGSLNVTSAPGQGAQVTVALPVPEMIARSA
jgi:PAS domain S-box-containing protein